MATSEASKERGDVVDIAIEMGEEMVVNPEILAARRVKWFQQKFEREAENLARNHVEANRKVEYLGGMEGISTDVDGKVVIDPKVRRSRWGKWLVKKMAKEGEEGVNDYLAERRRRCELAEKVALGPRNGWRKQQRKTRTAQKTITKTQESPTQMVDSNEKTGDVPKSNSTNKPAAPACTLEVKSTTASPAGDSHDGNAEKVGRAETSDDSIPGAAQSDSGVHTSAVDREVHVQATAVDSDRGSPTATKHIDSGTPTAPADKVVHVEAALLRSRWGQWVTRQLGPSGRQENGARVREGREMGEQVAQDTARLRARWRQQLVRNGKATKTTKVRSQSNSSNKPAATACTLEVKSTTASPAGDSHDGNAEKVGRAEISDDSIPGAAQSDSGVHTSAVEREVHVQAAAVDSDRGSPTATKHIDSGTPTAPADKVVHVEAVLLRSRWGQWVTRQSGHSEQQENGARVREGREMGEQVAQDTARLRARWRQQLVRNGKATKTTKVDSTEKTGDVPKSNNTNKPAAPACTLEVKSTTASPAGDRHDGNAKKVGRAETSDDSIPCAAQSDSGVHTSAVEVHVQAAAVDSDRGSPTATKHIDSGTPTAPADKVVHVEAALLRSRWGQWVTRQLGPSGRQENGARVREGREMGEQVAQDTARLRARWRQQLVRNGKATNTTKDNSNEETGDVAKSDSTNKPAAPACKLEVKSTTASPAGDSHDGNAEKVGRAETSDDSFPGAAQSDSGVHTSALDREVHVHAAAVDSDRGSTTATKNSDSGTPTASVDRVVHVEAALLRSRWGQWVTSQSGPSGRQQNGARVREGREMGEQVAQDTARLRARWRQQLVRNGQATKMTKHNSNEKTGDVANSNSTNKPAAPACSLEVKSTTASPAGDSHAGNAEKVGRADTSDDSIPGAAQTDRGVHTSAVDREVHVHATALDSDRGSPTATKHSDSGTPTASVDRAVHVEAALLRSRWGQWVTRQSGPSGRQENGARVREGREMGEQVAQDTARLRARWRQQLVRNGEATKTTKANLSTTQQTDISAAVKVSGMDTPNTSVSTPSHSVQSRTQQLDISAAVKVSGMDTPKVSVSTPSHNVHDTTQTPDISAVVKASGMDTPNTSVSTPSHSVQSRTQQPDISAAVKVSGMDTPNTSVSTPSHSVQSRTQQLDISAAVKISVMDTPNTSVSTPSHSVQSRTQQLDISAAVKVSEMDTPKVSVSTPSHNVQDTTQTPDISAVVKASGMDTPKVSVSTPSHNVQDTTQPPDISAAVKASGMDTPNTSVSTPSHSVQSRTQQPDISTAVKASGMDTPKTSVSTPSHSVQSRIQQPDTSAAVKAGVLDASKASTSTPSHNVQAPHTSGGTDVYADTVLLALCGHFGEESKLVQMNMRSDCENEVVEKQENSSLYMGAYTHAYDWIFGGVRTVRGGA